MQTITLIYKRLPNRVNRFQQELLYTDAEVIVTTQRVKPSSPIVIEGETVLGDGYKAVWFVFDGCWYDIGKIYNPSNVFTGYYCDIIMPMTRGENRFEITDLFLDVWVSPDGSYQVHDEDEFQAAVQHGWIQPELATQAQDALKRLIEEIESGAFPPAITARW